MLFNIINLKYFLIAAKQFLVDLVQVYIINENDSVKVQVQKFVVYYRPDIALGKFYIEVKFLKSTRTKVSCIETEKVFM